MINLDYDRLQMLSMNARGAAADTQEGHEVSNETCLTFLAASADSASA
jgi:hypothetical protein